jgi:anti-sigma B factor antagonist
VGGARTRPASTGAHLDLTQHVPVVVVDVREWLDMSTAGAVRDVLDSALRQQPRRLVVDLSACELADAYGLGMLDQARHRAELQGTELVLTGVNARLARVIRLLGLDGVLPVEAGLTRAGS